uniref:Uncharacterized protein n=1 Tax=Lepeophtheirus salmonis TaxID=72036 RepID=A0A0K2T728_LEPSM
MALFNHKSINFSFFYWVNQFWLLLSEICGTPKELLRINILIPHKTHINIWRCKMSGVTMCCTLEHDCMNHL